MPLETGTMVVLNMAVIAHCLVLTSGNIQLPSPLGSTAWLRLGLLSKLGQIFLPEDPFSSGACKYHSVIVMFSLLQPSPQGFHPLPGYSVKETAGTGITPDSELSLKNRRGWGGGGKWGGRNAFHQSVTSSLNPGNP